MKVNLRPLTFLFDARTRRGRALRGLTLWCGILGSAFLIGTLVLAPMMVDAAGLNRWMKSGDSASSSRSYRKAPKRQIEEPVVEISYVAPKSGETTYKLDDDRPRRRRHRRKRDQSEEAVRARQEWQSAIAKEADEAERRDSEHVEERPSEEKKSNEGDGGNGGDGT